MTIREMEDRMAEVHGSPLELLYVEVAALAVLAEAERVDVSVSGKPPLMRLRFHKGYARWVKEMTLEELMATSKVDARKSICKEAREQLFSLSP